ncbi:hypothetical protein HPB48_000941 [Haemaphysalis longicornis]|uniref:Uncharacterized protein n=1 Tax=Haemaphysalis longicornis TaxID=44386 RepID=A0A9J6G056_HAELO|nr:hypothetical protein HPB48_000941 [Haemaphysalis longicornis]
MAKRRSTAALRSYAAHIKSVCPKLPAVSTLVRKFRSPETGFQHHKITFPLNCTASDSKPGYETCQIFQELPRWNELLWFVKLELKETSPRQLTVAPLPSPNVPTKRQEVQRAAVCLHWLLSQHRCVVSVEPHLRVLDNYPELFWDALKQSTSVRTIRLSNYEFDAETASRFFSAISSVAGLEYVELDRIEFSGDLKKKQCFTDSLKSLGSLKTLVLTNIYGISKAEDVTEALRANPGLTELTVDVDLEMDDIDSFYTFISASASLTELTIVGRGLQPACGIEALFEVLMDNGVLRKLRFKQFCFDLIDTTLLSDMLTANATLQELSFSSCHWQFVPHWPMENERQVLFENAKTRWGLWWRVDPFVSAIKNGVSLRRLEFDDNHFLDEEMWRLLGAVKEKDSFEELRFGSLFRWSIIEFCHIMRNTGTSGKVAVDTCFSKSDLFVGAQECAIELNSIRRHSFYDLCPQRLQNLCSVLKTNDNITALELAFNEGPVHEDYALPLANYLASTTVLKEIDMGFDATDEAVELIIDGVSKNESLEKLTIKEWYLHDVDVLNLCDWLEKSPKLYHLVWICLYARPVVSVLLSELCKRLQYSYTLTCFCVDESYQNEQNFQAVKHLLRRNVSLVERAVHFILGSRLKICATAFELVSWHPLVLCRVQELASVSTSEAREKIRESSQRLNLDFWRLSGIVKEEFVCHKAKGLELQIDQLGLDAWQEVRKFITVADIVDGSQA